MLLGLLHLVKNGRDIKELYFEKNWLHVLYFNSKFKNKKVLTTIKS